MINFNKRVLPLITSGTICLSLCSCSGDKVSSKNDPSGSNFVSSSSSVSDNNLVSTVTSMSSIATTNVITTNVTTTNVVTEPSTTEFNQSIFSENDKIVLEQFDEILSDVNNSKDDEGFLDKGKKYFIYSVDFIFYDGEIKGVKFSDLTDSAKQQLLSDIVTIDNLICSKFPNYKETIGNGAGAVFGKLMELIRAGSKNIKDFSRDKMGEDNYNKLGQYKDLFIETAFGDWDVFTGLVDGGKQKVKNWYENFRNNNQPTSEGQN